MKQVKKICLLTLCLLTLVLCDLGGMGLTGKVYADTIPGSVKSLYNKDTGIKIYWYKDETADGYYVYRKTSGSTKYVCIKVVTKPTTTSYTDTDVYNGGKYQYKVCSYNNDGSVNTNTRYKTMVRVITPSIKTLESTAVGQMKVVSSSNLKFNGFQIKYGKKSDFSDAVLLEAADVTRASTVIKSLTKGSTYYVKLRSYITDGSKKYYSNYSAVSSVKIMNYTYMYTTNIKTYLYEKPSSASESVAVWYNTKLRYMGVEAHYTKGDWLKFYYDGKTRYVWVAAGDEKFTKTGSSFTYTGSNTYEQEVIDLALSLRKLPNEYGYGDNSGIANADGKLVFNCSGFASYVLNTVMQKYAPAYRLSSDLAWLTTAPGVLNEGLTGSFTAKVICEGTLDLSKLKAGDMIFFKQSLDDRPVNHCGLYLGNGEFIESTRSYGGICIAPLKDMYIDDFVSVIRFLPAKVTAANKTMVIKGTRARSFYKTMDDSSETGEIIDTFPAGTEVTVLYTGNKNKWAYVKFPVNRYGFIRLDKLEEVTQ